MFLSLLIFLEILSTFITGEVLYKNHWAVEVKGGHKTVEEIAKKHGFINLGQIGSLENHYLFEHQGVIRQSNEKSHHHHHRLRRETEVAWVEQQVIKKRTKRDLLSTAEKYEPHFNDPNWSDQWYLHGGATGQFDMNVLPVWKQGITGKGAVVSILDDGIERDHPDLIDNYDPKASFDVNSRDNDPMPRYNPTNENRHGTRCAGEVSGAANNSQCGVGVAYHAKIGGVRMLDGEVTDSVEAQSLSLNPQHVDIYSASWGPDDDGRVVDGPGPLAKKAFVEGAAKGRGGKGSIFVWASGNGGAMDDSCSCDGYSNSIYTISVSSTSEHGTKPWYLEECASTLATTYSSGENFNEKQIATTDLHHGCTKSHTGTSASAPLAAGLFALVLEANPEITWRDMQYIVLMTARPEPMVDGQWMKNGVGRKVSHRYGYGLMDANEMVKLAQKWTLVPEKQICEEQQHSNSQEIKGKRLVFKMISNACANTENAINFLEHVQIKLTFSFEHRGDILIHLTSPSGTRSTVLPRRRRDSNRGEFRDWPFLSVFFWGENPAGTWTLEIENSGYGTSKGTLESYQLILHGTGENPVKLKDSIPEEYVPEPDMSNKNEPDETTDNSNSKSRGHVIPQHDSNDVTTDIDSANEVTEEEDSGSKGGWLFGKSKSKIKCHEECDGGCNGTTASDCKDCTHFKLGDRMCVKSCPPEGYFADSEHVLCVPCHGSCKTCSGPKKNNCLGCGNGLALNEVEFTCMTGCSDGYFIDETSVCKPCSEFCAKCEETADKCTACPEEQHLEDSQCITICKNSEFLNGVGRCELCSSDCETCSGPGSHDCLSCPSEYFYLNESCNSHCDMVGYYEERGPERWACQMCHPTCKRCTGPEIDECIECELNLELKQHRCDCRQGDYKLEDGTCQPCHDDCETCRGESSSDCIICTRNRFMYRENCVETCRDGFFPYSEIKDDGTPIRECRECHVNCKTCRGDLSSDCTSCLEPLKLVHGECHSQCLPGQYKDNLGICRPCDITCAECKGHDVTDCMKCDASNYLYDGRCLSSCPDGYYGNSGDCRKCDETCKTCSGAGSMDCTSCLEGYELDSGICSESKQDQEQCYSGEYYDKIQEKCLMCDISCKECSGSGDHDCISCVRPNVFDDKTSQCLDSKSTSLPNNPSNNAKVDDSTSNSEKEYSSNETTKQNGDNLSKTSNQNDHNNGESSNQNKDNNKTEDEVVDHARYRTAASNNAGGQTFKIESPGLTDKVKHIANSQTGVIVFIAFCCIFAVVLFFGLFGILQARSNRKWCFKTVGYEKVPTKFNMKSDRILLTQDDFDDEDEFFG